MEEDKTIRFYDESNELWYEVRWDDEIGYYVWNIAPHQRLVEEAKSESANA